MLILEPLATNKYTVKYSFNFVTEVFEQDFGNFMGRLCINSHFTNIRLGETIKICTNNLFKRNGIVHDLKKKKKKKTELKIFYFSQRKSYKKTELKIFFSSQRKSYILYLTINYKKNLQSKCGVSTRLFTSYCIFGLPSRKLAK